MTVKELIAELKQYPQDAVVVTVVDWENPDEFGLLETKEVHELASQTIPDNQFGDDDEVQVIVG